MRSTSFLLASDRIIDYRVLFSYSIYAYAVLCYCREMHYIIYIYTSLRTLFINISRAKFYSWSHLSLILSLIKIVKNSTICISVSAYSTWLDSLISTDWLTHFCDYDSIIQPDPLLPYILYVKDFMENGTIKENVYRAQEFATRRMQRGRNNGFNKSPIAKTDVVANIVLSAS